MNNPISMTDPTGLSFLNWDNWSPWFQDLAIGIGVALSLMAMGAPFWGALAAVGSSALGSGLIAAALAVNQDGSYGDNVAGYFHSIFRISALTLLVGGVLMRFWGPIDAGSNGIIQGFVKAKQDVFGGITFGGSSVLSGAPAIHEMGHTVQAILMALVVATTYGNKDGTDRFRALKNLYLIFNGIDAILAWDKGIDAFGQWHYGFLGGLI